jgi:lysozyme
MTLFGCDSSNNNFSDISQVAPLIQNMQQTGFSWIEAKVSQGSDFQDEYWPATLAACQAIGFPVIGYHFVDTSDPATQAACFVGNNGGNVAMLDVEDGAGDITNFWAVVDAFNAAGVQVVLSYIPQWYWEDIGSPDLSQVPGLISSAYPTTVSGFASSLYFSDGGASGEGWAPYGGATPVIWQFTDAADVDGFSLDCNAFEGTLDQLTALLTGVPVTQPPAPTPPAPTNPPAIPEPADQADQVSDLWGQLLTRWEFLGGNTPVEALGAIGAALKIPGYTNPLGDNS